MASYLDIARQALKKSVTESDQKGARNCDGGQSPRSTKESVTFNSVKRAPKAPYAPKGQAEDLARTDGTNDPRRFVKDYDPEGWLRLATGERRPDRLWNDFSFFNDVDLAYLTSPLAGISSCPWCGRRDDNHALPHEQRLGCVTLSPEWIVTMPMGRHRGTAIAELDTGYLRRLQRQVELGLIHLEDRVRHAVDRVLNQRRHDKRR